jgi:hypothetical protein
MSQFAPQPIRVDGPSHPGEEICHIVTNDDPDTALCRPGRSASCAPT